MVGVVGRGSYSGCVPCRLWRGPATAAALALALAGCTISSQFDRLFASADKAETTGSIGAAPRAKQASKGLSDGDLAYARAAASEALRRDEKDASLPWENPQSGARGTVTPIASAYNQDGHTCRNFLASYVNGGDAAWLTGEACRQGKGAWEVRSLKPWKRS